MAVDLFGGNGFLFMSGGNWIGSESFAILRQDSRVNISGGTFTVERVQLLDDGNGGDAGTFTISGGGSDHAGFQNFLGIAVLNYGFGGEDQGGIYHSIYDDFYWYTHFSDTDFAYGKALSQVAGTTVMRLADADLLPFDFSDQSETIQTYIRGLQSYGVQQQNEIRERNLEIDEGAFTAGADPKEKYVPPARQDMPPHLNLAPLQNSADALTED